MHKCISKKINGWHDDAVMLAQRNKAWSSNLGPGTVALGGQKYYDLKKKNHKNTTKCFWGNINVTEQLQAWQANSKRLIESM